MLASAACVAESEWVVLGPASKGLAGTSSSCSSTTYSWERLGRARANLQGLASASPACSSTADKGPAAAILAKVGRRRGVRGLAAKGPAETPPSSISAVRIGSVAPGLVARAAGHSSAVAILAKGSFMPAFEVWRRTLAVRRKGG
jgi:hypothetical protein